MAQPDSLPSGGESTHEASSLLRRVFALNHEVERQLGRDLEVNATDLEAMQHLMQRGPLSPSALAGLLMISTAAATASVDRLVHAGHVSREPHAKDRRSLLVVPAEQSVQRARTRLGPIIAGSDKLLGNYSPQQQEAITDFLAKTTNILSEWLASARKGPEASD